MNTLKRIVRIAASAAVLATVVIPLYLTMPLVDSALAQPPYVTGHTVWDPVDQIWRCLGTPVNCDW